MNKITLLFALISLNMSTRAQVAKPTQIADHFQTSKFDVAIFPKTSIDIIPGKRFTPTRKEVENAEAALAIQLKELNKPLVNQYKSPVIHKKLSKYKRQYFGYINESGKRILFINSFWNKKEFGYWLASKIDVLDGGSYYWNIKFDIDTQKFFNLYINGSG